MAGFRYQLKLALDGEQDIFKSNFHAFFNIILAMLMVRKGK